MTAGQAFLLFWEVRRLWRKIPKNSGIRDICDVSMVVSDPDWDKSKCSVTDVTEESRSYALSYVNEKKNGKTLLSLNIQISKKLWISMSHNMITEV